MLKKIFFINNNINLYSFTIKKIKQANKIKIIWKKN